MPSPEIRNSYISQPIINDSLDVAGQKNLFPADWRDLPDARLKGALRKYRLSCKFRLNASAREKTNEYLLSTRLLWDSSIPMLQDFLRTLKSNMILLFPDLEDLLFTDLGICKQVVRLSLRSDLPANIPHPQNELCKRVEKRANTLFSFSILETLVIKEAEKIVAVLEERNPQGRPKFNAEANVVATPEDVQISLDEDAMDIESV